MVNRRMAAIAAVAMLAAALSASCGTGPQVLELPQGLKVLVSGSQDGSGEARLSGELTDIGGCVGFVVGDERWVAVFPEGTQVTSGGRIDLGGDGVVGLGDKVSSAGSTYGGGRPVPEGAPAIPQDCSADRAALMSAPVDIG